MFQKIIGISRITKLASGQGPPSGTLVLSLPQIREIDEFKEALQDATEAVLSSFANVDKSNQNRIRYVQVNK